MSEINTEPFGSRIPYVKMKIFYLCSYRRFPDGPNANTQAEPLITRSFKIPLSDAHKNRYNKGETDEKTKKTQTLPAAVNETAGQPETQGPPVPPCLSGPKRSSGSVQRTQRNRL